MKMWFIIHYLMEKKRAILNAKDITSNVFKGIISILFILYLVAIALYIGEIPEILAPDVDFVALFTRYSIYYFLIDIILRFLFQGIPILDVKYYQLLPIKRKTLVHYPLLRSLFGFLNVIPCIFFLSFFFNIVLPNRELTYSITWIIIFISLIFLNNYLGFYLKKMLQNTAAIAILILTGITTLLYLEFNDMIHFSSGYLLVIDTLCKHSISLLIVPLLVVISYYMAYVTIEEKFYDESITKATKEGILKLGFKGNPLLNLILLELKLILRNKRPRNNMLMSVYLLVYSVFFYQRIWTFESDLAIIGFCSLVMAIFALQHGQFLIGWDSSYFDRLSSLNLTDKRIITSKYLILSLFMVIGFVLMLPYIFVELKLFKYLIAILLFHLGISATLTTLNGCFNTSRIELDQGIFMNYQGVRFNQFLLVIPMIGLPLLVFWVGELVNLGLIFLIGMGVLGLMLQKYSISLITRLFTKRKVMMAENFRIK